MSLKIGDFDLDFQGLIGLETSKGFVLAFKKLSLFEFYLPT